MVKYITTNEQWDISRQEDDDFIYFYLHGSKNLHFDTLRELMYYRAFSGIELRDGCLCIRVLKSEL